MALALCSTSDFLTFGQNWHNLHSSSEAGKDLSTDIQIRGMGSVEPKICRKMLRNLSKKLAAKFPATTLSYSVVKIACFNDALLEIFELKTSSVHT